VAESETPHGYHIAKITRGVYGEDSKIYEEVDEFADALDQNVSIMALVELADVIGAIKGWLAKHHPSITINDLVAMAAVTDRAFQTGARKPKETNDDSEN
jgi:hypothetical protein